jgi:hypothetical protein
MRFIVAILLCLSVTPVAAQPLKHVWLRDAEARKSGKPILYYFTLSQGCPHCVRCDRMLSTPLLKAALLDFACVKVVDPPKGGAFVTYHRIKVYPSFRIFRKDMKRVATHDGCPSDVPTFLVNLDSGRKYVNGEQHTPRKGPLLPTLAAIKPVKELLPTLAAPFAPRTQEKVEGPQRSVVVTRPSVPVGSASDRLGLGVTSRRPVPRSYNWTPSSAGRTQAPSVMPPPILPQSPYGRQVYRQEMQARETNGCPNCRAPRLFGR